MKKLSVLFTVLFFSASILIAQETQTKKSDPATTKSTQSASKEKCNNKNCCMMKDGKMVMMKDGKEMPMEKDVTLANGTKIMTDGSMVTKDGKKSMMKNDDCIDMSGKSGKMGDQPKK